MKGGIKMDYVVLNGSPDGAQPYDWCVFDFCTGKCSTLTCGPNCGSDCGSNCGPYSSCTRLGCGQGGRVTPYSLFDVV